MSFYRQIVRQALKLAWHYKFLWIFGILAALSGNTGEIGLYIRNINLTVLRPTKWVQALNYLNEDPNLLTLGWRFVKVQINQFFLYEPYQQLSLVLIFGLVIALVVLIVCLVAFGQIGLISATEKIYYRKNLKFSDLIKAGLKYFWKIILMNIFGRGLIYLIIILFDIPLIIFLAKGSSLGSGIFAVLLFIIIVPLGIAVSFILRYASCYIVLKDRKIKEAVKFAYKIFIRHPIVTLEMSVIILLINIILGAITTIPLFFLSNKIIDMLNTIGGFWIVLILDAIVLITLLAFLGAFLSTFQMAAWTMLFFEIIGPKPTWSKFARTFKFMPRENIQIKPQKNSPMGKNI